MPVPNSLIRAYSAPALVLPARTTLRQSQAALTGQPDVHWLVVDHLGRMMVVARVTLMQWIQTFATDTPLRRCPLPDPARVVFSDTDERPARLKRWLLSEADRALLVVDAADERRVTLLVNPSMSASDSRSVASESGSFTASATPDVHFTAYLPVSVAHRIRQTLYVYAHLTGFKDQIDRDIQRFTGGKPDTFASPRMTSGGVHLPDDTAITVRPVADGVQFYPAAATLTWQAPWLRFPFDFTVSDGVTDDSLFISLNIEIDEQEVANIKGLLNLTAQPGASLSGKPVQYAPHSSALYRRIFVSYSRRDTAVIEKFYRMQQLVGDDVFVDIHSILPGSDWQQALREAIQSADIFMLFWSPHSATSTHVRDEWQYALTHRCQETGCVGYIRPVYWQDELYPVPPELQHLHFKQVSI